MKCSSFKRRQENEPKVCSVELVWSCESENDDRGLCSDQKVISNKSEYYDGFVCT